MFVEAIKGTKQAVYKQSELQEDTPGKRVKEQSDLEERLMKAIKALQVS